MCHFSSKHLKSTACVVGMNTQSKAEMALRNLLKGFLRLEKVFLHLVWMIVKNNIFFIVSEPLRGKRLGCLESACFSRVIYYIIIACR